MHSRLPVRLARLRPSARSSWASTPASPFTSSAAKSVQNSGKAVLDALAPTRAPRPPQPDAPSNPDQTPSRRPGELSDARNPFAQGYPRGNPRPNRPLETTTSTASPDSTTSEPPSSSTHASSGSQSRSPVRRLQSSSNTHNEIVNPALRRQQTAAQSLSALTGKRPANMSDARALEGHLHTTLRTGDVYAPHDLSPAEHIKARYARSGKAMNTRPTLTRSTAKAIGGDPIDALSINPINQYKNFSMLSEWVTETGRIRSGRDLGFTKKNQRKVSKAIRRAVGMGIFPSVHRHPELLSERESARRDEMMRGQLEW